jgi:hypothetical protein
MYQVLILYSLFYSVDGSDSMRLMRFVNDAPTKTSNCISRKINIDGRPHICLFAKRNIDSGEELRYDYGGDDLPWRKVSALSYVYNAFVGYL